jgi:superfamily I DNA/RNA helicase
VKKEELPNKIANIICAETSKGIPASEICVVAPQWGLIFGVAPKLKELLPDVSFDAPDISPVKYDRFNPFYLMARLVFTESGQKSSIRKKVATELLSILRDDCKTSIPDGIDNYDILKVVNQSINHKEDGIVNLQNCIEAVFHLLKIQLNHERHLHDLYFQFFEKIQDRIQRYKIATDHSSISKFFRERNGVVLSTIHGIKGEEYTTVIAFALHNGYLPHWDYIIKKELKSLRLGETKKLLYVLCSRAKMNIYLFSETGRMTSSGNDYTPTDELITGIKNFNETQQNVK